MSPVLHSVPTGDEVGVPTDSETAVDLSEADESHQAGSLVYFAHLARLSLPLCDLDAGQIAELRRDLSVLVAEATRPRVRPALLHALLEAVLADLLPALPDGSRTALAEARPLIDTTAITAS